MSTMGRRWSLRRKDRGVPGVDFAVAVRDEQGLYLHLHLRREPRGDVFVNFWEWQPGHRPHTSYHESGRHHQKSYGYPTQKHWRPRPDGSFTSNENVVTTLISVEGVKAVNEPCNPADFGETFAIPGALLPADRQQMIAVDLVAEGAREIQMPSSRIVDQRTFRDAVPWILVTLWENDFALEVAR